MTTTARFYTKGPRGIPVTGIVIHSTQSQEKKGILRNIIIWMSGKNAPHASAHVFVDNVTRMRSVDDVDIAWATGHWGTNRRTYNIELTGSASQSRAQWLDAFSLGVHEQASIQIATWLKQDHIPFARLSPASVRAGGSGIFGHVDVTHAFNVPGGHVDPGPNFPWDELFRHIKAHMAAPSPVTPPAVRVTPLASPDTGLAGTHHDSWETQ